MNEQTVLELAKTQPSRPFRLPKETPPFLEPLRLGEQKSVQNVCFSVVDTKNLRVSTFAFR